MFRRKYVNTCIFVYSCMSTFDIFHGISIQTQTGKNSCKYLFALYDPCFLLAASVHFLVYSLLRVNFGFKNSVCNFAGAHALLCPENGDRAAKELLELHTHKISCYILLIAAERQRGSTLFLTSRFPQSFARFMYGRELDLASFGMSAISRGLIKLQVP